MPKAGISLSQRSSIFRSNREMQQTVTRGTFLHSSTVPGRSDPLVTSGRTFCVPERSNFVPSPPFPSPPPLPVSPLRTPQVPGLFHDSGTPHCPPSLALPPSSFHMVASYHWHNGRWVFETSPVRTTAVVRDISARRQTRAHACSCGASPGDSPLVMSMLLKVPAIEENLRACSCADACSCFFLGGGVSAIKRVKMISPKCTDHFCITYHNGRKIHRAALSPLFKPSVCHEALFPTSQPHSSGA